MADYLTVDDVVAQLNATGPDANNNYTVYGLTIQQSSIQAHVDFANDYVTDIAQSGASATNLKLAALDLACIRTLVIVTGGSLIGAFDYFLGDLRVARAGPFKEAIAVALQGFKDDLTRQMTNLTPIAVTFTPDLAGEVDTSEGPLLSP